MKYEKPEVEVVKFENIGFMTSSSGCDTYWPAGKTVTRDNVYDFLATQGITRDQILGGGVDAVQINESTKTVICSYYQGSFGKQFQWN